jgi:hypothetical protein
MSDKKGIVLNRMYTGSYLSSNLGHEVINMFQDDKGRHYLYLNAKGNYAKMHDGEISNMLLVRYAGFNKGKSEVQVLGWAKGLKSVSGAAESYKGYDENSDIFLNQQKYICDEKITYGGANLIELFEGSDQQNIYITYSAAEFYRPQIPIYIQYVNEEDLLISEDEARIQVEEDKVILHLSGHQFGKATLKQYIYPTTNKNGMFKLDMRKDSHKRAVEKSGDTNVLENVMKKREGDWKILLSLLNENYKVNELHIWVKDKSNTVNDEGLDSFKVRPKEISLFDIMPKLQRDENCFSDALKFFMNRDKEEWHIIFKALCNGADIGSILSIEREKDAKISTKQKDNESTSGENNQDNTSSKKNGGGRIDLLIRTENAYIVIENKIKSDINSKESDQENQTQLDRYRDYVAFRIMGDYINGLEENVEKNILKELYDKITATNFTLMKSAIENKITSPDLKKSYFFVLAPDYNMPDKDDRKGYLPLYYSTLVGVEKKSKENEYSYLKDVRDKMNAYNGIHKSENLWSAFYDAMQRHSYDYENDSLYEDMKNTFFARIQNCPKVSPNTDDNA